MSKERQEEPGGAIGAMRSLENSGEARRSQEEPGGARSLEEPRARKSQESQVEPGRARGGQEDP